MKKILVVALGGTIGSIWGNKITPDKNPLKVLDYYKGNAEFECISPFVCLSENMTRELWRRLIDCLNGIDCKNTRASLSSTEATLSPTPPQS